MSNSMRSFVRMSEMDESKRDSQAATTGDASAAAALVTDRRAAAVERSGSGQRALSTETKETRVANLAGAMRRARLANAERSGVLADLRDAEIARLEILRDHLEPVLAQAPKDCDLFDIGVSHGDRPRLFIDHVGFVEMGRDRRTYRFLQDTRHGRITIGETDNVATVVEAITEYIAHRLIEREKALGFDFAGQGGARAFTEEAAKKKKQIAPRSASLPALPRLGGVGEKIYRAILFLAQGAGAAAFFFLLWQLGVYAIGPHLTR
ncbi:hypothetical protein FM996_15470 [Methylosinus sporium]|uniref:Uncharacterized protein n=3 Tax=Methylocystaceae TaxID=31993 RepID=A0A2U1SP03_METSR|nr:hypothetical protein [Methylosinus sp. KRF6]PWB93330.1 hypothetical protein C5689_13515 [Methylosinus sporium]TRL30736.1 hypothetical protein FM996_15470 [Methylosinus sporium]